MSASPDPVGEERLDVPKSVWQLGVGPLGPTTTVPFLAASAAEELFLRFSNGLLPSLGKDPEIGMEQHLVRRIASPAIPPTLARLAQCLPARRIHPADGCNRSGRE